MSAFLDIQGVDKVYNPKSAKPVRAVQDLTLAVQKAEIVALLGSSGCGKTSTLRMIAGFEEVSRGAISIDGKQIHLQPPAKRGVAMAFEGYSLYPPLTVRDNIGLALKAERLGAQEVARRVVEIAALLEIEDVLDRYPSSISGGQQQRASLGRALIRRADLHLLDEPMGQLEPQLRALLRGRIKHYIREHGLTAILVTHDQTEANALADRIAVMEDGELQQFDTPEALKERPANLFTGTFIGEPPMNVFAAKPVVNNGRLRFVLSADAAFEFAADAFPDALHRRVAAGAPVTLGVRPHAVQIVESGLPATVAVNQWLGDQTHIAAEFAGGTLVSVAHDRAPYTAGTQIAVAIAANDLHIFDPDSGRAIAHGSEAA